MYNVFVHVCIAGTVHKIYNSGVPFTCRLAGCAQCVFPCLPLVTLEVVAPGGTVVAGVVAAAAALGEDLGDTPVAAVPGQVPTLAPREAESVVGRGLVERRTPPKLDLPKGGTGVRTTMVSVLLCTCMCIHVHVHVHNCNILYMYLYVCCDRV